MFLEVEEKRSYVPEHGENRADLGGFGRFCAFGLLVGRWKEGGWVVLLLAYSLFRWALSPRPCESVIWGLCTRLG